LLYLLYLLYLLLLAFDGSIQARFFLLLIAQYSSFLSTARCFGV
jgi:hypothetical protein